MLYLSVCPPGQKKLWCSSLFENFLGYVPIRRKKKKKDFSIFSQCCSEFGKMKITCRIFCKSVDHHNRLVASGDSWPARDPRKMDLLAVKEREKKKENLSNKKETFSCRSETGFLFYGEQTCRLDLCWMEWENRLFSQLEIWTQYFCSTSRICSRVFQKDYWELSDSSNCNTLSVW